MFLRSKSILEIISFASLKLLFDIPSNIDIFLSMYSSSIYDGGFKTSMPKYEVLIKINIFIIK